MKSNVWASGRALGTVRFSSVSKVKRVEELGKIMYMGPKGSARARSVPKSRTGPGPEPINDIYLPAIPARGEEEEEEEEEFFNHYKNDLERHAHTPSTWDYSSQPSARSSGTTPHFSFAIPRSRRSWGGVVAATSRDTITQHI